MTVLLFLTFVAAVCFYLVSVKESSLSVGAYILGLALGLVSIVILKFVSFDAMSISANFWVQTFRFFLTFFLLPALISLPLFFLISFSLSEETVEASPAHIFGVFTVIFFSAMFRSKGVPNYGLFILLTMLYTGTVFLFYSLLQLCCSFVPAMVAFFIALLGFLGVCFLASTALSSRYFSFSSMTYFIIALSVLGAGVAGAYVINQVRG